MAYVGGTGGVVLTTANMAVGNGAAVAFTKVSEATAFGLWWLLQWVTQACLTQPTLQ